MKTVLRSILFGIILSLSTAFIFSNQLTAQCDEVNPVETTELVDLFRYFEGHVWTFQQDSVPNQGNVWWVSYTDNDPSTWHGVGLSNDECYVDALYLQNVGLQGRLRAEFFEFEELQTLDLSGNAIYDTVGILTSTPQLTQLNISNNRLNFQDLKESHSHYMSMMEDCPDNDCFIYAPQRHIPTYTTPNEETLYVEAGDVANNTYNWYNENDPTSIIYTAVADSSFTPSSDGSYFCEVSNSLLTISDNEHHNLVLRSIPSQSCAMRLVKDSLEVLNFLKYSTTDLIFDGSPIGGNPNISRFAGPMAKWPGIITDTSSLCGVTSISITEIQFTSYDALPDSIHLPVLQDFYFSSYVNEDEIPVFNTPQLTELNMPSSFLSGTLNGKILAPNIERINLSHNKLNGGITDFAISDQLQYLDIHSNQLSDTNIQLPQEWQNLYYLNLSENQFEGAIPDLSEFTLLEELLLNDNELADTVPVFLENEKLKLLNLGNNELVGTMPNYAHLSLLEYLYLHKNQLNGSLMDFNPPPLLKILHLHDNDFNGELPTFENAPLLWILRLSNNQIQGNVHDFSGTPLLERLYLDGNDLEGEFPELNSLTELRELYLSNNNFSGNLPTISNSPNFNIIEAGNNNFSGEIPNYNPNASNLRIDVSHNQLTGTIPALKSNSCRLLLFNDNQLSGSVPNLYRVSFAPFSIANNHFVFADLEEKFDSLNIHGDYQEWSYTQPFIYYPQQEVPTTELDDYIVTLSVLPDGHGHNVYQWYTTSDTLTPIHTSIIDGTFQPTDLDTYFCKITNPYYPKLTLKSTPYVVDHFFNEPDNVPPLQTEDFLIHYKSESQRMRIHIPNESISHLNNSYNFQLYTYNGQDCLNGQLQLQHEGVYNTTLSNPLHPGIYFLHLQATNTTATIDNKPMVIPFFVNE